MKQRKLSLKYTKWLLTLGIILLYTDPIFGQDNQINTQINIWGNQIKTILNAVVGIFSIVGGFLIFIQYMQGNEQAQKNFIRFIIGLAIFGLIALIANIFLPGADITNDWSNG
jgi:surface polysaccharide O-acyltransferase-like enzyme